MDACDGRVMGGKMVWACQQAVPRPAMSRMFGVRSTLRESGRRPSIEMITTIGRGGGVGWVGGAGATGRADPEPQATASAAAAASTKACKIFTRRGIGALPGSTRPTAPKTPSSPLRPGGRPVYGPRSKYVTRKAGGFYQLDSRRQRTSLVVMRAISPQMGKLRIQAAMTLPATPHFTAERPRVDPTPM